MFNAGSRLQNLSSCFLLGTDDSIGGIFKTISDCAQISKVGGGIGLHINNIRSKGTVIRGTNGHSDGIIPMLKVYNETAKYVNQSGKRKGSFAIYLSPEHPDIFEFLDLRKNQGSEALD
jgi:ribonucleotide reductase alpha subunit